MTFGFFDSHEDIRYSYQHSHPCAFQKSFHSSFAKKQGGLLPFLTPSLQVPIHQKVLRSWNFGAYHKFLYIFGAMSLDQ